MGGIVDVVVVGEPDGKTGVPLEYSGIGEGGAVATLERRVIWVGGGLTLCTGLKTAVVGSPTLTVTGHQSMAVVVMAGMEMVVVMVWVSPPAADDSSVVVSGGHEMVVVEPSCDGGSTSVHGGMHEAVAPPPGAQMLVGTPVLVGESQDARAAALPEYRRILDAFAASSVHLAAPLTHQAFPKTRTFLNLWPNSVWQCLELTCFHVPPGALERQLFEHAFGAFERMTEPSVLAGIPVACTVDATGGWQPEPDENSGCQVFTGVLFWNSPAARAEWYEELFRLSCESYELFGQKLDALKILAAEGVVTRFLELQKQ
ncbi:predicted protein [Chaetomium globosum CBS 148.51]|uniref:Uncharacterized protein n=1 Tax=Chaetomium globosum (strain ATCC 6205 / CBS 148.51 / DSM 1962 / NBRC 6347 / NRRL 1970) TaxID=306901 RepID=Q2GVH6_CHAGB|nr:uncharacterized protein CHGG_08028 [Chaetomium globosum CBS 148.51]EAQ86775.1 predicted protein [Chaetomium globosum CBS 148.51]